jgi:hypothetical protein
MAIPQNAVQTSVSGVNLAGAVQEAAQALVAQIEVADALAERVGAVLGQRLTRHLTGESIVQAAMMAMSAPTEQPSLGLALDPDWVEALEITAMEADDDRQRVMQSFAATVDEIRLGLPAATPTQQRQLTAGGENDSDE